MNNSASCEACNAIPFSLFTNPPSRDPNSWVLHHKSYHSLEMSAAAGCNFCNLLYTTIGPVQREWPHPCFETDGYDPLLFPERRMAEWNDERFFLHLAKHYFQPAGTTRVYLVCRFGEKGARSRFSLEYSGDVFSSTLYPKSNAAILLMKFWLNTCLKSHMNCGIIYDASFMPSRVINVGSERQNFVNLTDTTLSSKLPRSEYLTLSHCWGPSMPGSAKTTSANLSRHLRKIRIRKLPRTFRDAIMLTRRLGYRYIWIDSLCIIQDSVHDWSHESALMGKIYSHSHCTLAAAGSADCNGGLFARRTELPILQASTSLKTTPKFPSFVLAKEADLDWMKMFYRSPLNTRGWTLQERELSPRIIYFTKHSLLFECREARGGEREIFSIDQELEIGAVHKELEGDAPAYSRAVLIPKTSIQQSFSRRCMDEFPLDAEADDQFHWQMKKRYRTWRDMVEMYSMRALTNQSDRFPALSGLASEMAFLLDDEYIAGLWKGDIINGLCWTYPWNRTTGSAERAKYGPTWSWATTTAPVSYKLVLEGLDVNTDSPRPEGFRLHPAVQHKKMSSQILLTGPLLLSAETIPAGDDPNGTLLSASLKFMGQCIAIRRSKTGNCMIDGESIEIVWDHLPRPDSDFYLFNLCKNHVGLVLTPQKNAVRTYQRVGIVQVAYPWWFKDCEPQKITLV